jgi:hypothetical protein
LKIFLVSPKNLKKILLIKKGNIIILRKKNFRRLRDLRNKLKEWGEIPEDSKNKNKGRQILDL